MSNKFLSYLSEDELLGIIAGRKELIRVISRELSTARKLIRRCEIEIENKSQVKIDFKEGL